MEYKNIYSLEAIEDAIATDSAALFYFSTENCNVCKVLRPKLAELLSEEFPLIRLYYIGIEVLPLIAGQFRIFAAPTLLVFFEGREHLRKSRNVSVRELSDEIRRPYGILFSD